MTLNHALIAAEIATEIAFERYQSAFDAQDHPEVLDVLATEADITQRRYEDILMNADGSA